MAWSRVRNWWPWPTNCSPSNKVVADQAVRAALAGPAVDLVVRAGSVPRVAALAAALGASARPAAPVVRADRARLAVVVVRVDLVDSARRRLRSRATASTTENKKKCRKTGKGIACRRMAFRGNGAGRPAPNG